MSNTIGITRLSPEQERKTLALDEHNPALRRPTAARGSTRDRAATTRAPAQDPGAGRRTGRPGRPRKELPLSPALRTQQARELGRRIEAHLDGVALLDVTITNNKSVMISVDRQPRRRRYGVRLHHMFVDASDPVIEVLASYIVHNDRCASNALGRFIDSHPQPGAGQRRRTVIRTEGRHFDLAVMFGELNERYFDGALACRITWGRQAARGRARRVVRLGSYTLELDLIRVHPGLDQDWVPRYFVEWVVFHEMLHASMPAQRINGRHRFHTPELRRAEQRFAQYELAAAWEKANIAALLSI